MIKLITFNGCNMYVDDSHHIHICILQNGLNYENHVRKELERIIPNASSFWDIGSNVGLHTVSVKQIKHDIPIVCFEPCHVNNSLLCRTIAHNKWNDVIVFPVAVGNHNGICSMNNCVENPNVVTDNDPNNIPIGMIALDSLCIPTPDVVKIDVEGSELDALSHAVKLMKSRPVIITEYAARMLQAKGQHLDYIDFLFDHGYSITVLDSIPNLRRKIKTAKEVFDYVCEKANWITDLLCEPI